MHEVIQLVIFKTRFFDKKEGPFLSLLLKGSVLHTVPYNQLQRKTVAVDSHRFSPYPLHKNLYRLFGPKGRLSLIHIWDEADPIKKEGLQKLSSLLAAACKLCQEQPDFYQAQILSLIYDLIYILCTTFPASGKNAAPGKAYRHYARLRPVTA